MKKEVKLLWDQIKHKGEFMMHLAEVMNRSPKTLKSHWFSNDPIIGIPKDKEQETIQEMRKWIKNQDNERG